MKISSFVCSVLLLGFATVATAQAQALPGPSPTAVPSAAPAPASASPAPESSPAAAAPAASPSSPWKPYDHFALLTPLAITHVSSELTPGTTTLGGFNVDSASELKIWKVLTMVGFDFHQVTYQHEANYPVPAIGGGTTIFPTLTATEYEYGFRGGVAVVPHTYVGFNSIFVANNYGNPELIGYEFGVERLPDFSQTLSFHGKFYTTGNLFNEFNFVVHSTGETVAVSYRNFEYEVGAVFLIWVTAALRALIASTHLPTSRKPAPTSPSAFACSSTSQMSDPARMLGRLCDGRAA